MLSDAAIIATIESRFNAMAPALPAAANRQYDGNYYQPVPGVPWVRLMVEINSVDRETLNGNPQVGQTTTGLVTLQYHAPIDTGWNTATTWRDQAANIFNEGRVPIAGTTSYLVFTDVIKSGPLDDAPWSVYTATIDFLAYENPTQ